ncbi:MAG: hypothetical protein NUW07_03605 [Candidatus Saccharicenans sp.]|jgi:hypothetical protein|nr:hypothetical protein [Candidatus Saccharicenans sp.]MDH7492669.1 hypothetical protein [Candidatus Saccharicenans sp.]
MNGGKALNKEMQILIGDETDNEARLKKIYERVQSIKNLDFVNQMPEKERKKIKIN